jgi:Protein of unknown function (DUF4231)
LRAKLREVLVPRFVWADQLAVRFSHLHRSAYILFYLLGAVAVVVAVAGPQMRAALGLGALLAFGFIGVMTVVGRRWRWQERWLEYRALAENLRHGRFLAFVSEFGRAPGFAGGGQGSEPAWMLWYYRATARELGLPKASLNGTYQWRLLNATLHHEINNQRDYHGVGQGSSRRIDRLLHRLSQACFILSFVAWALFLFLYFLDVFLSSGTGGFLPPLLAAYGPFLVFCITALSALGMALVGIRVHGDFAGQVERSELVTQSLAAPTEFEEATARDLRLDDTAELLIDAARVMSDDVVSWQGLYGRNRLTLPG